MIPRDGHEEKNTHVLYFFLKKIHLEFNNIINYQIKLTPMDCFTKRQQNPHSSQAHMGHSPS